MEDFWRRRVAFSFRISSGMELLEETIAICLFLVSPLLVKCFPGEKEVKLRVIARNGQKIIPKPKDEFDLLTLTKRRAAATGSDKEEGVEKCEHCEQCQQCYQCEQCEQCGKCEQCVQCAQCEQCEKCKWRKQ